MKLLYIKQDQGKILIFFVMIWLTFFPQKEVCSMDLSGKLIFTCRSNLCCLDLNSLSLKNITRYEDEFFSLQTSVTLFNDDVLIERKSRIKMIDLATGREKDLFAGVNPHYVPSHDILFFYRWSKNLVTRSLMAKEMKADIKPFIIMTFINRFKINDIFVETVPPVQISDDEVLFIGNDFKLTCYNMVTGNLESFEIKNIQPFIYRSKTDQVLCLDYNTLRWLLFSPKNKKITYIYIDTPLYYKPITYIPDKDILIYTGTELAPSGLDEINFVMAFDFENGTKKKLVHRQGTFGAVWINK